MKKMVLIFALFVLMTSSFSTNAKNLWAFLTYSTFNSPEGPYIETYLSIAGNSVKYIKKDNGKFQATVNVVMTFKQKNDIKAFNKYELKSPEIADTNSININFVDQQRFSVPNGVYDFEIQITDKYKSTTAVPYSQVVLVDFPSEKPSISGIELIKSHKKTEIPNILSKSGNDLQPYVYTFYPENEQKLTFYCEIYNLDKVIPKDQKFLLTFYIETFENNLKLNDFARSKPEQVKDVIMLLKEFSIENLATGNYNLVIEARNSKNELLTSKKLFFQRINPNAKLMLSDLINADITNSFSEKITSIDTLREYINSTFPISMGLEKSFIRTSLKTSDLKTLQQYFYSFWQRRSATNPEKAWKDYKFQVERVQANFGTPIKKGYQTDRGRVFLQYGAPNAREEHVLEPDTYPYEIWQYYTLNNNQRNKKFLFYSPDRVTSDYVLMHSDAIGEIYEPRYKVLLRNKLYAPLDLQDTQVINVWGDQLDESWALPTSNL